MVAKRGQAIGSWQRAKFEVRGFLDRSPLLFRAQAALRGHRRLAVSSSSDIVIEGFPRSGNTYAVAAFRHAQGSAMHIARHLHAPAQVFLALRYGVPALVVVRRLPDPVLSMVVRDPALSLTQVLKAYARFHEDLLPVREAIVLADFDEVISDFGSVIHRVNERYATTFREYRHTDANEAAVRGMVEEMDREDTGAAEVDERSVARPSATRDALKASLRERYEARALAPLRARAEAARRELFS